MKKILEKFVQIKKKITEKINLSKVKTALAKVKLYLKKSNMLKKLVNFVRKYRLYFSIGFFCAVAITLILVAMLGWQEFIVPVCALIIIEALMAALLHRVELWIHAVLLVIHIVTGVVIDRLPMVILCVIAYIAATITLHFAFIKKDK